MDLEQTVVAGAAGVAGMQYNAAGKHETGTCKAGA